MENQNIERNSNYWMISTLVLAIALVGVLMWIKISEQETGYPVKPAVPTPVVLVTPTVVPGETSPGQTCVTDRDCGPTAPQTTVCQLGVCVELVVE